MSKKFEIKTAVKQDVPVILKFIKELAEYEKLAHEVTAATVDLERFLFGEHPCAEVIIGYLDDKPVSFALFYHNFSTFLGFPGMFIEDLFVLPEARDQEIGQTMLAYIAQLAKKRSCKRLEWRVLDWNEHAIGFYRSIGAKPLPDWTIYRMTDSALDMLAKEWK